MKKLQVIQRKHKKRLTKGEEKEQYDEAVLAVRPEKASEKKKKGVDKRTKLR